MADELKFPDPNARHIARDNDALDESAVRLIREAYRPPVASGEAEAAYWNALESRIMAHVRAPLRTADKNKNEDGWWAVLNGWSQVGLVAAAALFAVAGVVGHEIGDAEEQVAYESVIQPSTPEALSAPAQLITASNKSDQRDAALQYVLSY